MAARGELATNLASDARALVKRTWWVFLIGGIAAVIFGILAFMKPGIALMVLAMFFAAWILVDGVSNLIGSFQNRDKDGWWIMLLIGILGICVGGFALFNPPVSMLALIYLVAFQAILLGVFLLMLGYKVRAATEKEWILYVTGALSVLFGILVIMQPEAGGVTIVYMVAGWAILIGLLKIYFGFKIKNIPDAIGERLESRG